VLRSLYIRDYALIDELEVEFDSGLNVITGETGAGKSILIGALKMILGGRASTEVIRTGARKAIIEGVFSETQGLNDLLEAHGFEAGTNMVVRREIGATLSRAFINDTPATATLLRAVAGRLIDLHGQHEHQSLLHTETHLELLDNFGGLGGLCDSYRKHHVTVDALMHERDMLSRREGQLRQQKELFAFQIEEIDRVDPQNGEEEALEAEHRILENAEHLFELTARLFEMLYETDTAVHDQLVVARNEMQDLARIDHDFEESFEEIRSAQIIVAEVAKFLQDYNARVEFNPERLETIRNRLGELERLKRRYGGTLAAVLSHRQDIGAKYELAADFEGAFERLAQQIAEAQTRLTLAADRLSSKRREVAESIQRAIVAELDCLGMANSRFEVRFSRQKDSEGWICYSLSGGEQERFAAFANGMDQAEFFLSTNPGEDLRPLNKIASGGEISRIMLALKTILAKSDRLPILVFDEIDTGVSGAIAHKVGDGIHDLAQYHQIITITHLPQIAALGDVHFTVEKNVEEGRTRTRIRRLSERERAKEVATLLSGSEITEAALESARELIAVGRRSEQR